MGNDGAKASCRKTSTLALGSVSKGCHLERRELKCRRTVAAKGSRRRTTKLDSLNLYLYLYDALNKSTKDEGLIEGPEGPEAENPRLSY